MRLLLAILLLVYLPLKAQFFGRKSIAISHSLMQFNEPFLANKTNANNATSWVSEVEKINSFKPSRNSNLNNYFSYSYGIGLGVYNNLDNRFEVYEKSNFVRLRGNLICHLPEMPKLEFGTTINKITPYFKIGYLTDKLDKNFKAKSNSYFCSSMNFGGGVVFRATDFIGLNYDFSINQRLNNDYRTFAQHKIGLVIALYHSFKIGTF